MADERALNGRTEDDDKVTEQLGKMRTTSGLRRQTSESEMGKKGAKVVPPGTAVLPNYFVAIRVTSDEVRKCVRAIQDAVLAHEPNLEPAIIPLSHLHVTLLMLHLREGQVQAAKEALRQAKARVTPQLLQPVQKPGETSKQAATSPKEAGGRFLLQFSKVAIPFEGLGTFADTTVFAKVAEGGHLATLKQIAETVRACFAEKSLYPTDDNSFLPHLTVMKITDNNQGKLKSRGIQRISPSLYEGLREKELGSQSVEGFQLCSLRKKRQADGYFHVEEQVKFGPGG
ncbi:A-kinase anchor protein 7-like [Branchiostoma lanceolatum]|uniref:A-kinase anchor protein 7-like n=1 Tax=Branchiostoma lanceolatum TaxID=7740 RepID=UPI003453797C